jgi:hypothetical protein
MAKKKSIKANNKSKKAATRPTSAKSVHDQQLREHLLFLLKGGGAHISFDDEIGHWTVPLAGTKVANFPHTAWMLLEHMRLAQWDILEFCRNVKYAARNWPDDYWPASEAPLDEKAWAASIAGFKKDLRTMQQLVANPKVDLYARIPWGDGHTMLREALLVADHNAYHLGQLVMLRKSIGS